MFFFFVRDKKMHLVLILIFKSYIYMYNFIIDFLVNILTKKIIYIFKCS